MNNNIIDIIEEARDQHIHSLYLVIGRHLYEKGTFSERNNQVEFLNTLEILIKREDCIILFRDYIKEKAHLDKASLAEKILYISNSFPNEYDENVPEKDIENLWWYFFCPIDIGWKQPDGRYFIYD